MGDTAERGVYDTENISHHPAIMAAYLYIPGEEPHALSVD